MDTLLASIVIPIHATTAFLAITLGPVNMVRRRRDRLHRNVGRSWIVLMYATSVSGLFIVENGITLFHALAVFTICTVTLGLLRIRKGDTTGHAGNMIGSYIGLLIAFGFAALLPERLIWQTATTHPLGVLAYAGSLCLAVVGWVFALRRAARQRARPQERAGALTNVQPAP
ncbi:DUF2306 domain-containing protein [Brevibacterium yomogidense]|uniref:DUF2306 domain-containing protein n=1 Tax=Brevibacterium yomogidense TaxID=946573 RepID=UPI0018DF14DA|nr:DUF2306 domain-containing protein [Brevibacterium yomogidense]